MPTLRWNGIAPMELQELETFKTLARAIEQGEAQASRWRPMKASQHRRR